MSFKDVTKETAYSAIKKLVERFSENHESYKNQSYNETQTRIDFINPFFKALGWDMDNEQGFAESYREVKHEDKVMVGENVKSPDYCFTIRGQKNLFYLEAKKPSVDIKTDIHPAYQVRRYGWTAGLLISVVTDFEELAIYDTTKKPNPKDNASVARIKYLTYKEYLNEFDFIWNVLSQEQVLKGNFDKYVKSDANKKGTSTVDAEFVKSLESWREELAKNITSRNKDDGFTEEHINYAVQNILDRLIFLRICEDRGVEPSGKLQSIASEYTVYQKLIKYFLDADDRYNSGLFRFKKDKNDPQAIVDDITPKLILDDKVLKQIIKELYYPECPYQFSVMPIEILGHAYEQFLGKVIRITKGGMCKVEEKPEVRKAGGVYYTPQYIVEYIVKNTVGELIEGKKPKDIEKIKIIDPACGSGSFLIGAYKYLLNYHLEYYTQGKQTKEVKNVLTPDGKLTTNEKKRILLNNIYGVDIDTQAVEVTKLSLLLKAMEGETEGSIKQQMALFHERVLPTLDNNIKCGNSLIGHDFYDGTLDLDNETIRRKIKPFDWNKAFPEIFKEGGFDAVIGNPPWGGNIDDFLKYLETTYPLSTQGFKDTYKSFLDKSISLCIKDGFIGMITPNTYFFAPLFKDIRLLMNKYHIAHLINLGEKVFEKVNTPSSIIIIKKNNTTNKSINALDLSWSKDNEVKKEKLNQRAYLNVNQEIFLKTPDNIYSFFFRELQDNEIYFEDFADIKDAGIQYHRSGIGMQNRGGNDLYERLFTDDKSKFKSSIPCWYGELANRYFISNNTNEYFNLDYKKVLKADEQVSFTKDFQGLKPKIIWRQTSSDIKATLDEKGIWFRNTIQCCVIKDEYIGYSYKYLLAIINSRFFKFLYDNMVKETGRVFPQVKIGKIKKLPIRLIDFKHKTEVQTHNDLVALVDTMLQLNKDLYNSKTDLEKQPIKERMTYTDQKIDKLVYKLYGLADKEIIIIEGSIK